MLLPIVTTEFNIEGNPDPAFMKLVLDNAPHQCTLVPDTDDQLTSDHGWDTIANASRLKEIIAALHEKNIRVSMFVDPDPKMVEGAKMTGADRIELYTGPYAHDYKMGREKAIAPYKLAAKLAGEMGLGVNAGHDLNLDNLRYFKDECPELLEVSIGHALISDALYFGLSNTIKMYLRLLS
jgi:pyridoxine 5-phosphate synthase